MARRRVGLALFWLGVVWTFFWGILASIHQNVLYGRVLAFEEFEQTIWATTGPLMNVWGNAVPLGVLLAALGMMLYSGVRRSAAWVLVITVFSGVIVSFLVGILGHFPPLYAVGAALILLFFFGILWLWAQERTALRGHSAAAADLKLAGYVFMLIAIWYTCGIAGPQWIKAFADQPPAMEPITIMILFALGWLFLFLGHYKAHKAKS
jgi:hypothetical protein